MSKLKIALLVLLFIAVLGVFIINFLLSKYGLFWQKKAFLCPLPKNLCQKATVIDDKQGYWFGYNLPSGTSIYASLSGWLEPKRISGAENSQSEFRKLLTIRGNEGFTVIYVFPNDEQSLKGREITEGEEILKAKDGIAFKGEAGEFNFLFGLQQDGKILNLKIKDLKMKE
jgi:hypothetical protein